MYKYVLRSGTLQPYIYRESPHFMYFFGSAQYKREKPIITPRIIEIVSPILDKLNSGELTESEVKILLDKIW